MRLLLDECIGGRQLAKKLTIAGHDVARSVDAIGTQADDLIVFTFAQAHNRAILTYNNRDFESIGKENPEHAGIISIYRGDNERTLRDDGIVRALANVRTVYPHGIAGQIIVLNHYRW